MSRQARVSLSTSVVVSLFIVAGLVIAGWPVGSSVVGVSQNATTIRLLKNRFRVSVDFDDGTQEGKGQVVQGTPSGDSGLFWFFDEDNWEMLVKVLDGCAVNNRIWVFAAATTNVEFTLKVRDTVTGQEFTHFNPQGHRADAINNTDAFAECASLATYTPEDNEPQADEHVVVAQDELLKPRGVDTLTLNNDRFRVEVDWQTQTNSGDGMIVPFGSDDSGLIYFFDPDNWEMLVKVLDGCGVNNHFWVFFAATTNVGYQVRVTDQANGQSKTYTNAVNNNAETVLDTSAFATCGSMPDSSSSTTTSSPSTSPSTTPTTVTTTSSTTSSSTTTTSVAGVSFRNDILPIVRGLGPMGLPCTSCHNKDHICTPGPGHLVMDNTVSDQEVYDQLVNPTSVQTRECDGAFSPRVNTADPQASLFIQKPISTDVGYHPGAQLLQPPAGPGLDINSPQIQTFLSWIQQGAPNN